MNNNKLHNFKQIFFIVCKLNTKKYFKKLGKSDFECNILK